MTEYDTLDVKWLPTYIKYIRLGLLVNWLSE